MVALAAGVQSSGYAGTWGGPWAGAWGGAWGGPWSGGWGGHWGGSAAWHAPAAVDVGPGPGAWDWAGHGGWGHGGYPGVSLTQGPAYAAGHGHGVYVAKTRGAVHTAPLAGHVHSATALNVAPAPGTH